MENKTRVQAYERVNTARTASFVDPSNEYLESLRFYLLAWVEDIETVLRGRAVKRAREQEAV